jgi:hypothetical protein
MRLRGVTACLLKHEPATSTRVVRLNRLGEGTAKASLNRAQLITRARLETWRASPEQAETPVTGGGGPNQCLLKKIWMTWD